MANKTNEEENIRIGKLLQQARESGNVTQNDMAEICGLSKNHLSAIERGVSKPSIEMLIHYSDKLGTTPNQILGYDKEIHIKDELMQLLSVMNDEQQDKIIAMIKIMM